MADLSALGNFKGVMLCNRPAQIPGSLQTVVGPTATSGPTRPAFVSAVVPDSQLGLPPIRHSRVATQSSRLSQKHRSEDVTWRHKKWLGEFQERRQAISSVVQQKAAEQAARRQRFAQRNQLMRDTIRGIKTLDAPAEDKAVAIEAALSHRPAFVPTEYVDVSQQYPAGAPRMPKREREQEEEKEQSFAEASPVFISSPAAAPLASNSNAAVSASPSAPQSHRSHKASKAPSKPGWARTAAEDDDLLDAEAEDLLSFVGGLDYEKYIEDMEVREAIQFVADRVKGLEASKQTAEALEAERQKLIAAGELEEVWVPDTSQPPDAEGNPVLKKIVRRVRRQKQALTLAREDGEEWDVATGAQDDAQTERSEASALSKAVLDSNRNMRNIHSSASVRAMMDKEAKTASAAPGTTLVSGTTLRRSQLALAQGQGSLGAIHEQPLQPPTITTVHEIEGGKRAKGPDPSNLPFLYRHPGI